MNHIISIIIWLYHSATSLDSGEYDIMTWYSMFWSFRWSFKTSWYSMPLSVRMAWIYFASFISTRFLNILKISRMMLAFLFGIKKSRVNLVASSMNVIRYLFPLNDGIYIDPHMSEWISVLFSAYLLLMDEKDNLYIFLIA